MKLFPASSNRVNASIERPSPACGPCRPLGAAMRLYPFWRYVTSQTR